MTAAQAPPAGSRRVRRWAAALSAPVLFMVLLKLSGAPLTPWLAGAFPPTARGDAALHLVAGSVAQLVALAGLLLAARTIAPLSLPRFDWSPPPIAGWLAALSLAGFYGAMMAFGPLREAPFLEVSVFNVALSLVVAAIPALIEEALFRGYLMEKLRQAGARTGTQVLISALAFGAAHLSWGALGSGDFDGRTAAGAVFSTAVLGGLLAGVYVLAGRRLLAPMLAHGLINLVVEPWLMLTAARGSWS